MTRSARTILPGHPHHVIVRGNNRRRLFSRAGDYLRFLDYTMSALPRSGCAVHAMTMMSNHVHLVATPPDSRSLSVLVKHVAQRYASLRNRSRGASGKLFEERYFSRPLQDETDVAIVVPYVDLNPVRAGLAVDAHEYPWSTFAIHAGAPHRSRIPLDLWQPSAWYLALGASPAERAAAYLELARETVARGDSLDLPAKIAAIEALSERYTRRLERPDRSTAV